MTNSGIDVKAKIHSDSADLFLFRVSHLSFLLTLFSSSLTSPTGTAVTVTGVGTLSPSGSFLPPLPTFPFGVFFPAFGDLDLSSLRPDFGVLARGDPFSVTTLRCVNDSVGTSEAGTITS